MKCAVVLSAGVSQVMLWPENDVDKTALKLIHPGAELTTEYHEGGFYDGKPPAAAGYVVGECEGGWLRAYREPGAVMIVVRPKANDLNPAEKQT